MLVATILDEFNDDDMCFEISKDLLPVWIDVPIGCSGG